VDGSRDCGPDVLISRLINGGKLPMASGGSAPRVVSIAGMLAPRPAWESRPPAGDCRLDAG
jgi:hypothetical protein